MKTLRTYQGRMVDKIRNAMRSHKRCVAVMPTGAGKSVVGGHIAQAAHKSGRNPIWIVHKRELVAQAAEHLYEAGLEPGLIMAGERPDPLADVQVCSIQTLIRRNRPRSGFVFVDEAHHTPMASYIEALEGYSDAYWLGFTATPCRTSGEGLDVAGWGALVTGPTTKQLIKAGHLADYDYYGTPPPDMGNVTVRGGEYALGESAKAMSTVTGTPVEWYQRWLDGKQAIVFSSTVDQSMGYLSLFSGAGIPSAHADAGTPKRERDDIMSKFKSGQTKVLLNVKLIDEGFDVPSAHGVIVARPTQSLIFHRQACGRALRPKDDGSKAVIIDMAGNYQGLGMPCDDIEWALTGESKSVGVPSLCTCKACFATFEGRPKECPMCGAPIGADSVVDRTPREVKGDLVDVKNAPMRDIDLAERKELYWSLLTRAMGKGWKIGSVRREYRQRVGVWPSVYGYGHSASKELEAKARSRCHHERREPDGTCRFCGRM